MQDATGELAIVFNGEIYNFGDLRAELEDVGTFRSNTDTEVLLAAYQEWGTECLSKLNGMFAFALYDSRARHVFLARDRAGEKPLFYATAAGRLRFASELKGLMADHSLPRRSIGSLDCYLAQGSFLATGHPETCRSCLPRTRCSSISTAASRAVGGTGGCRVRSHRYAGTDDE